MEEKKKEKKEIKSRKFNLFGSKWTIKFVKNVMSDNREPVWLFGKTDDSKRLILISTHDSDDTPLPASEIRITILHELSHAILGTGQYLNCNADEPLVEWLARCIFALMESGTLDFINKIV